MNEYIDDILGYVPPKSFLNTNLQTISNDNNTIKSDESNTPKEEEEKYVKDEFVQSAVEYLKSNIHFLTIEETEEILYYDNGVYIKGGKILIKKLTEKMFGDTVTNHKISEIIGHIKRRTYISSQKLKEYYQE